LIGWGELPATLSRSTIPALSSPVCAGPAPIRAPNAVVDSGVTAPNRRRDPDHTNPTGFMPRVATSLVCPTTTLR
jgi:hypothetical protein